MIGGKTVYSQQSIRFVCGISEPERGITVSYQVRNIFETRLQMPCYCIKRLTLQIFRRRLPPAPDTCPSTFKSLRSLNAFCTLSQWRRRRRLKAARRPLFKSVSRHVRCCRDESILTVCACSSSYSSAEQPRPLLHPRPLPEDRH